VTQILKRLAFPSEVVVNALLEKADSEQDPQRLGDTLFMMFSWSTDERVLKAWVAHLNDRRVTPGYSRFAVRPSPDDPDYSDPMRVCDLVFGSIQTVLGDRGILPTDDLQFRQLMQLGVKYDDARDAQIKVMQLFLNKLSSEGDIQDVDTQPPRKPAPSPSRPPPVTHIAKNTVAAATSESRTSQWILGVVTVVLGVLGLLFWNTHRNARKGRQ
jgi:hypothetical protein